MKKLYINVEIYIDFRIEKNVKPPATGAMFPDVSHKKTSMQDTRENLFLQQKPSNPPTN